MRHSHPRFKKLFEELSSASSREESVQILQRTRQSAREEFPAQLAKLENLLLQCNPFTILATFAFVDLTYLPEVGRPMNDSGDIEQYHIELVQALILCHEEQEFKMRPFDPVEFQELRDLTSYVAYLHSAKDLPDASDALPKDEAAQLYFRSMLRAHTKAVRNWGYEEQTIRVLKQLYEPLEDAIERELGVRVCLVIDAIRSQLQTGLAEKSLPDCKQLLVINGLGSKLDRYFMSRPGEGRFERPRRSLSKWWRQILSPIEKKQVHRRYELGCVLLDMPDEEQHAFENQFRKQRKKVKRRKHTTLENVEAIWNHVKSENSNAVVVVAPVTTEIYPKRKLVLENFAARGMAETGANQAVVVLVDVELGHWPYSGIYLLDKE